MATTEDDYLSKGFERKMAEYFASGTKRIVRAVAHDDFAFTIHFDNGEKRLYDMWPLIKKGTVFAPFANIENFCRVYVEIPLA